MIKLLKKKKQQIFESSDLDKKNDVTSTEKNKNKTVVTVGNSIVQNVPTAI